jgi:hypothetical protein
MTKETSKRTVELVQTAVRGIVNGDKNHGWKQGDSLAAIEDVVANDVATFFEQPNADMTKYVLSDDAVAAINAFINPSAFRQVLETAKIINESADKKTKRPSLFEGFNA